MFENLILLNKYTLKFQKSEIENALLRLRWEYMRGLVN